MADVTPTTANPPAEPHAVAPEGGSPQSKAGSRESRVFLVVVDETEEMRVALRFAALRARSTGGKVAMLYVVEPSEFQHWMSVGDLMREEARTEAEQVLQRLAAEVNDLAGSLPVLYVREGDRRDELLALLDEEPNISILVLGASTGKRGPGPLVSALTSKFLGRLHIPVTIVPDSMTAEEIDAVT
ncbi:MAG: universal stress protein [Kiloniellaceae bacterium]